MPNNEIFSLHMRMTTLMLEAQSVMALRLLGMSGVISTPEGENARMLEEKGPTMALAFGAATQAMMAGQNPNQIISAAITPVSDRVTSNRKRLSQ